MSLSNLVAERMVLAGICKYGSEGYYDVVDLITEDTFTIEDNQNIYKCVKYILDNDDSSKIDTGSIFSAAGDLGFGQFFSKQDEAQHLQAILKFDVELSNVRKYGAVIRKIEIAKQLRIKLEEAQKKLLDVNGNEPINEILNIVENTVFDFSSGLSNNDELPSLISSDINEYFDHLANNPVEQIGINVGFPRWTNITGGLRPGSISIIGARPKQGKSILAQCMGSYVAKTFNIPVLYMDTEMITQDQQIRLISQLSGVSIDSIETGKYAQSNYEKEKVDLALKSLDNIPYYHKSISGMSLDDQLAIAKRWILREVGINKGSGGAHNCMLIYDYLKLMNSSDITSNMQEYQSLGFMISSIQNLAVKYKIPVLAFMQLNREGITKEGTEAVSGSDRLVWLASSLSIFKSKSPEEIAKDGGLENGNKKLIPIISRYGRSIEDGDYINCNMRGWCADIKELKMSSELDNENNGFTENGETQEF